MTGPELSALLERAADDGGRPLTTDLDALLERARRESATDLSARRRRRAVAALAAVAAGVVGIAVLPAVLRDRAPAPGPAEDAGPGPVVAAKDLAERCRPQLAKYADSPSFSADPTTMTWTPAHPERDYRAGDLVRLVDTGERVVSAWCLIPRADAVDEPVTFADITPSADRPGLLRQVCSEQTSGPGEKGPFAPDLSRAEVLASSYAGDVGAALLRGDDGKDYGCATTPAGLDGDLAETDVVPYPQLLGTFGLVARPDGDTSYVVITGLVNERTRTLDVSTEGGPTRTYPVRDGRVAVVHPLPRGAGQVRYVERDAAGAELGGGLLG